MSNNIYDKVDALNPQHTTFNLSHTVDFDGRIGEVYPVAMIECVPGDVIDLSIISKVRFPALVAPISDEIDLKVDAMFNPMRLVFNEELDGEGNSWEKFITQVPVTNEGLKPTFAVEMPKWIPSEGKNGLHSLWDYLGLPVDVSPQGKSAPSDLYKRCYNLDWNECYRDENLQDEVSVTENEDLLWSNVSKDYFTSAFLERQRGPRTGLPVSTIISWNNNAPFRIDLLNSSGVILKTLNASGFGEVKPRNHSEYIDGAEWKDGDGNTVGLGWRDSGASNQPTSLVGGYATSNVSGVNNTTSMNIHLNRLSATSTAFDISDWRLAWQIQKWQERSMRGGVRYTEFLHSFFGVNPRDDRLQRPEYIGGYRTPAIVQDVLQTSQTTTGSRGSAQGSEAGHMISADGERISKYRCVEYGILAVYARLVPRIKYTNGIDRKFLRNTPFDFYFPTFAHLSEQGIYNCEVFAVDDEDENMTIWGYQGIYNEMRKFHNKVLGGLRSSNDFLFWTMARKFVSLPNLNGNFISTKFMQNDFMRVFQVTDTEITYPAIFHFYLDIKASRPMPYLAIPM